MALAQIVGSVGRGLAAGFFGTAAMTVAQTIEMKLTGREGSSTPADAVEKVFDLQPESEEAEGRLSKATHWAYGTGWGAIRGLLGGMGLSGRVATPVHFLLVWGAAAAMLPRLGIAPPVPKWGAKQIASDVAFHGVYALAAGLAFDFLERRARRATERPLRLLPASTESAPVRVDERRSSIEAPPAL